MAKSTIQRKIRNKNVWFSPQHYTIEMVEKYFDERKKSHNDYFKFTFVRNPYDRIISEFIWLIEHHKLQAEISKVSFERWFKDQLNSIEISDHLLLQTDFITLNPFERFDFIGKVESLEKDFEDLLVMIGWEASQSKLGNQNKRKIDLKSDFLTASVKEEIYKAYRDDFIVLGYEK